jgi:hypothetical protein
MAKKTNNETSAAADCYADELSAISFGAGAIRCPAKLVVNGECGKVKSNVRITGIWGAIASPAKQHPVATDLEMWECDLVIVPKRKYSSKGGSMRGLDSDQMLLGGYEDPANWGSVIFEA